MSAKKTRTKEWDSTNHNLSSLSYSPLERKLRKDVQERYTKVHRRSPPVESNEVTASQKSKILALEEKKVTWEDWNLKEEINFEDELKRLPPPIVSPKERVATPAKETTNYRSKSRKIKTVRVQSTPKQADPLEKVIESLSEGFAHLNHTTQGFGIDSENEEPTKAHSSESASTKTLELAEQIQFSVANVMKLLQNTQDSLSEIQDQMMRMNDRVSKVEERLDDIEQIDKTQQIQQMTFQNDIENLKKSLLEQEKLTQVALQTVSDSRGNRALLEGVRKAIEGQFHFESSPEIQ